MTERETTASRRIDSIEASFYAGGSVDDWRAFAVRVGMAVSDKQEGLNAHFGSLPAEVSEGALYLSGGLHPASKDADAAVHWHLTWHAAPGSEPPKSLAEQSAKNGGLPKVFQRMTAAWPVEEHEFQVHYVVNFIVDGSDPVFDGRLAPRTALDAGEHVCTEVVRGWEIEPPTNGVGSVIILRSTKRETGYVVVRGSLRVSIDADMERKLEVAAWNGLVGMSD